MKKVLIVLSIFLLTGCGEKALNKWPDDFPKYVGQGDVFEKNDEIIVKDVLVAEVNSYLKDIKKEYSSVIVDNDSFYQGMNNDKEMIIIKYNKDKNVLKISHE